MRRGDFLALVTERFRLLLVPHSGRVDELDLFAPFFRLVLREDPHVGENAGVVEHLVRQGHDGLQQVVFQHVAAHFALPAAGVAGKQRRAVQDDGDPAVRLGLGDQILQEQQLAVADPRQAGHEARAVLVVEFLFHQGFFRLPLHPERRIGQRQIELFALELVFGERVAFVDVAGIVAQHQHFRAADGMGFRIAVLPEQADVLVRAQRFLQLPLGHGQHAAGAAAAVVDANQLAGFLQFLGALGHHQVHAQLDHFARGVVVARLGVGFVGADDFLEHVAHGKLIRRRRMEIHRRKRLDHLEEQAFLDHEFHFIAELQAFDDFRDALGIRADEFQEIGAQVVAVAHQILEGHAFGVVERHAAGLFHGLLAARFVRFQPLHLREHRLDLLVLFGQHAVEPPQDRHRDDHVAVFFGGVRPAQLVRDVRDQFDFRLDVRVVHISSSSVRSPAFRRSSLHPP